MPKQMFTFCRKLTGAEKANGQWTVKMVISSDGIQVSTVDNSLSLDDGNRTAGIDRYNVPPVLTDTVRSSIVVVIVTVTALRPSQRLL